MNEALLYFVLAIACLAVAFWADASEGKVLFIFSAPFIFFLGVFPLHFYAGIGIEEGWLALATYQLSWKSWFWLSIIIFSYPIAFLLNRYIIESRELPIGVSQLSHTVIDSYSSHRIGLMFYALSLISIFAFILNFQRVGFSAGMMFASPRKYEALFGQYWYINYLYFLHVPALILYSLRIYLKNNRFFDHGIAIILVLISAFHGIKYTVFDAVFFPIAFYIGLVGFKKIRKLFYAAILLFLGFFTLFSYFVRGADGEGIDVALAFLNYLIPNYYNLFYVLEFNPFPMTSPVELFFAYASGPLSDNTLNPGFILNYKYNMLTGSATLIGAMSVFGFVIFYALFNTVFIAIRNSSLTLLYVKAYILISYLMFFYSYYIGSKYKYIYFLLVFFALDLLLRERTNTATRKVHNED
jgi:hypothetical protein